MVAIFIYIFFFRDFGQAKSTTEETIDIIMLIPSNNNMITILAIKIQKTIKLLKYLQKNRYFLIKKKAKKRNF